MDEHKSWAIKNEAVLEDLVTLMGLTNDEKALLASLKGKAEGFTGKLVDSFYERLLKYPNTSEYVGDKVEHLRKSLSGWFVELFSGDYGQEYVQSRLKIGKTHVRIGLPVRYPLAMMDVVIKYGHEVAEQSDNQAKAKEAFSKLLALDIAIFNQAYEDSQLRHLAEMVGNERLARRLLTQEAQI